MKIAIRIFVVVFFILLAIIVDIFYFSLSFIFKLEKSEENFVINKENLEFLINWIKE